VRCPLGAPRFGCDQLRTQLIGKARDNFILHVEQVGDWLVEALGPEMRTRLRVDKLDVNAQPIAGTLNAAFKHITHV
jgi:hypothetical protein